MSAGIAGVFGTILFGSKSASAEDPWEGVEQMIVLGDGGILLETVVPSSAIEFDAEILSTERVDDIADLSNLTPNLQINTAFAASNPTLFIRGVGLDDFNANSASAVAIYQDGIYMNSPAGQLFQFFDVKGARVLRGPQAGRYRNAGAGAIIIESMPPNHEAGGYATFTGGNYSLFEAEGALNVPIIPDILAIRTSATYQKQDGFTKNRCNGRRLQKPNATGDTCSFPPFRGFNLGYPEQIHDRVNDAHNYAVRTQLLFDVPLEGSTMSWLMNVHGGENLSQARQFQHRGVVRTRAKFLQPGRDATRYQDTDGDPFAGDYNTGGDEKLSLLGANLKGEWEFTDGHVLKSITGWEWHSRDTLENTDANPKALLVVNYKDRAWQVSQDIRLESDWAEDLQTNAGVYYIKEDLTTDNTIDQQRAKILTQGISQKTRSLALYGELSWDFLARLGGPEFLSRFTLDGSVRYTREYKQMTNEAALYRQTNTQPPNCGRVPVVVWRGILACRNGITSGQETDTFVGTSGGAAITYDVFGDELKKVFIKYTRGWKPGHFNGGAFTSKELIEPIDPETVDAVEGGVMTSWFDDRLKIDANVFWYDYVDLQVFQIESDEGVTTIPQLINAQGAEILGAEINLELNPIEGLKIRFNGGWLDTEYSTFDTSIFTPIPQLPDDPSPPEFEEQMISYTGNRMVASPEWAFSGSIEYTIQAGSRIGEITPRFSFTFKDDVFYDVAEGQGIRHTEEDPWLPKSTIGQEDYWIFNASLTWRPPGEVFEIRGWVLNFLEEEYRVQTFDLSDPTLRLLVDSYGAPRTWGVTTTMRF